LELIFNPIRHHLSHHPCDRQKSYQSHFIGSIARSDLWGIKWLEAYPTFAVGCAAQTALLPTLPKNQNARTRP
jgi:hypothetical protein